MCDYSLEAYASKPAEVGERYKIHRFPSGSYGLAVANTENQYGCPTAACMIPGSKLLVMGIGSQHGGTLGPVEEATFYEYPQTHGIPRHQAALQFSDGTILSFQALGCTHGNHVEIAVISLPGEKLETPAVPAPERLVYNA